MQKPAAYELSIVIPCYNEKDNIPLLLEKFRQVLSEDVHMEVVLVDNGSTDGSDKVLSQLIPQYHFARTIKVEVNQGYGYGILQGLNSCTSEYIGWTHADLQTDPEDVLKAFRLIGNRKNVYIKGNRKHRPVFDRFFTIGMSVFESLYLKARLYDINAQPNIFPRTFYSEWENPPYDFSLDLYALYMAHKKGLEIIRFNVFFPKRIHGESKWNNNGMKSKIKFIKRTLHFSYSLKRRGIQ